MNALGSPLDALALDYLSLGFLQIINNLWTWVAVISAAISFWRIRAVGSVATIESPPPMVLPREEAVTEPISISERRSTVAAVDTVEGPTRGKFTVYYYEDESEGEMEAAEEVDGDGGDCGLGVVGRGGGDYWCDNWEKVMRMRIGEDMGWYQYQDLTALDGNVVRLWNGRWC